MPKKKSNLAKKPRPFAWNNSESIKKQSLKNEKRLSTDIGFKLTPGSGNRDFPGQKGDGYHSSFMFECKETKHPRISIGKNDIEKLVLEARIAGKEPVLILSVYGLPDNLPQEWIIIPVETFKGIMSKEMEND